MMDEVGRGDEDLLTFTLRFNWIMWSLFWVY